MNVPSGENTNVDNKERIDDKVCTIICKIMMYRMYLRVFVVHISISGDKDSCPRLRRLTRAKRWYYRSGRLLSSLEYGKFVRRQKDSCPRNDGHRVDFSQCQPTPLYPQIWSRIVDFLHTIFPNYIEHVFASKS